MCTSTSGFLNQSPNGDVTGCFRVPALHGSSLVVSLQTFLFPSATTLSPAPVLGDATLSAKSKAATPGETVRMTGKYLGQLPAQREGDANLCWDSCQTGLQEQGVPIHWTSRRNFYANLQVPDSAWLVDSGQGVSVHPLVSGRYSVGVQCIVLVSGCALGAADGQTTIQLKTPAPKRCVVGQRCETLQLSTYAARVGDEVKVTGWAPLQSIIGQPFGFNLSVAKAPKGQHYQALSFTRTQKGGGFNVVLAPKTLKVTPSKTWASLGQVPYLSSTWAGPNPVEPSTTSNLIAWCQPSGLDITGGPKQVPVSAAGVVAAMRGTVLTLFTGPRSNPPCSTVLLDPRYGHTVYAGFSAEAGGSAPPVYLAGLYTTNEGASWRAVPVPRGTSLEDFGGFTLDGDRVEALFSGPDGYGNPYAAPGTEHGSVLAEVTSNGGASWTSTTLGCPSNGPCATFGPYYSGNCAMNGSPQSLLVNPSGASARSGVKWKSSSWVATVNSCFSQQLAVTSPHDVMLLDPSSQYPLLQSTNSGQTWTYVALPIIPGTSYGPDNIPMSSFLLLAPDGSLFATVTSRSGLRQELFRLKPRATSWCQVPKIFGVSAASGSVGPLRTRGMDLVWSQTVYPNSGPATSRTYVVPLESLHC
jgi:hypothetical protein